MKKLVAGCVIICVLSFLVVGCEAKDTGQKDIISAMQIDDGAEKYRQMQFRCPVCGQKGIKPEYHASVDGKRIYFDRRKCMEKFKKTRVNTWRSIKRCSRNHWGSDSVANNSGQ